MKEKCLNRIKPFKMVFLIKVGEIVNDRNCNTCYRVNKLISFFFHLYYSGLFLFVLLLMFHYIDLVVKHNVLSLILTFTLYIFLEIFIALIIPLKKVQCEKKDKVN
jgi:hypothetical protein